MSSKNYNNINVKKEIHCRDIEGIYGKFVRLDCGFCNFHNISGENLTYTNGTFTNLSALNANIFNLNLNNTTITNISLTETSLNNIPYVRYNDTTKQILYKNNHYGEFISTISQTALINNFKVLTYNLYNSYGITLDNITPSKIVISQPGIYKIGTSIQFDRTSSSPSGKAQCYFWFRKNNQDILNSTTSVFIPNKNEIQCGYAEIIQSLNQNDWIEVVIGAEINDIDAHYSPATTSPALVKPAIPSVITTIYQLE